MADKRPNELNDFVPPINPTQDVLVIDQGAAGVNKANVVNVINSFIPVATEAVAIAGTNNQNRMTPLRTKQHVDARIGSDIQPLIGQGDITSSMIEEPFSKSVTMPISTGNVISSGVLTLNPAFTLFQIDTEGGAAIDELTNIVATGNVDFPIGSEIILVTISSNRDIVIKHNQNANTGVIRTRAGRDISMLSNDSAVKILRVPMGSGSVWIADRYNRVPGNTSTVIAETQAQERAALGITSSQTQNDIGVFSTEADFIAANIPVGLTSVQTKGYYSAGDGGGHTKVRISTPSPVQPWHKQSADGAWWAPFANEYNVRMFGAAGNYSTDDTAAFQVAIDFVGQNTQVVTRTLFVPAGSYRITSGLVIPETASHFFLLGTGSGEGIGTSKIFYFHPGDASVPVLIDSKIQNFTMLRISFQQNNPGDAASTTLPDTVTVRCKRPSTYRADVDSVISECRFNNFNVTLEHWGRGLELTNNTVSVSRVCIDLYWPNEGDYAPTPGVPVSSDLSGYRAFVISGNRFHSIGEIAIRNTGTNAKKIHAVQITDNLLDIGRRLFEGCLVDGIISNNVITMTPVKSILLTDGSKNYFVGNMVIGGNSDASRIPDYFIEFTGEHTNALISGLTLGLCSSDAIRASSGSSLIGVRFSDIVCGAVGGGSSITNNVIRLIGSGHNVFVDGITYTGQQINSALRCDSGSRIRAKNYSSVTATPLTTYIGVSGTIDVVSDGNETVTNLMKFWSYSGSLLGSVDYQSAGTNGITLTTIGSLNLNPENGTVRPMTDGSCSFGLSSRRFLNMHAHVFRQNHGIGTTVTPDAASGGNGQLVIETTSNTTLTFKLRGSDGTVRSGTLTLS